MVAHDIFISYSTKDKTIADAVCAKLEENNIRAWIAPRDVLAGANYAESIVDAIDTCKIVVLIWSTSSNSSEHILNEINQAFDQGIIIIPFRIQDVTPNGAMRYYIGRTHWLDAIDPPLEKHIASLIENVLINLGREPQDMPQPVRPEPSPTDLPIDSVQPPPHQAAVTEAVIEEEKDKKPPDKPSRQKYSEQGSNSFQPVKTFLGNLPRFVPIAAGGLFLLSLVVLFASGVFKNTPTISSTPAATQIPAWITEANEFAEPILALMKEHPPDFADDFSQVNPAWMYYPANYEMGCFERDETIMSITDGTMNLSLVDCRVAILIHPDMQYSNYVLQLDVNFQQSILGLEFRMWNESLSGNSTLLSFFLQAHDDSWGFQAMEIEDVIESYNGNKGFDNSKPVTVTIINKSPTFLVYVDSSLLMTYQNTPGNYDGPFTFDFTVNTWQNTLIEPETLKLDNIKVWDLDKIE